MLSSFYAAINHVFYLQDNSSPGDKEGLGRHRQNCQENRPNLRVWLRGGGGGEEEAGADIERQKRGSAVIGLGSVRL